MQYLTSFSAESSSVKDLTFSYSPMIIVCSTHLSSK